MFKYTSFSKNSFISGDTYFILNKFCLGYSEVEIVQHVLDGIRELWEEDKKFQSLRKNQSDIEKKEMPHIKDIVHPIESTSLQETPPLVVEDPMILQNDLGNALNTEIKICKSNTRLGSPNSKSNGNFDNHLQINNGDLCVLDVFTKNNKIQSPSTETDNIQTKDDINGQSLCLQRTVSDNDQKEGKSRIKDVVLEKKSASFQDNALLVPEGVNKHQNSPIKHQSSSNAEDIFPPLQHNSKY